MTSVSEAEEVRRFWRDEVGRAGWFVTDPAVDAEIARRFGGLVERALVGDCAAWAATADGALALLIVLDQFPRNLFRDGAKAFAGDALALETAERAIEAGFDLEVAEPQRLFFYTPFEHAEDEAAQDRAVALIGERLPGDRNAAHHAEQHRDLIRRFGRFPHRNAALGRANTPEEDAHLADGGYAPGARPAR
ncbi:MAG: DUF924 family protein [Pseudomonadota bacterium]